MSISLILFFLSLLGIIFMVGRKLTLVQSGSVGQTEHPHLFTPDVQKIKEVVSKNTRKHSYTILVTLIRSYVQLGNFLKSVYEKIKIITIKRFSKNTSSDGSSEKPEVSKFLKLISDYKHKIRNIKHRIIEEEKNGKV